MYGAAKLRSALAVFVLMASPCMAAASGAAFSQGEHRAAAFAGANLRVSFGGRAAAAPSARLQLTTIHSYRDRASASPARTYQPAGVEFGLSGARKPALFLMGEEASTLKKKLGLNGGSTPLWILGGLAAAGAAIFIFSEITEYKEPDICCVTPAPNP